MFIVQISLKVQRTIHFTPGIRTHSFTIFYSFPSFLQLGLNIFYAEEKD